MAGADAQLARAIALEDSGRPEEALAQYQGLLQAEPQHADARHNLGLLLARLGRFAEAETSHREYIRRHPLDPRAHGDLADVLIALARFDEALSVLETVLQLRPDDAPALILRGVALSCLRRLDEARQVFVDAVARHPQAAARFVGRVAPSVAPDPGTWPESVFFAQRYMAQGACDWRDWEGYVAEMRSAGSGPAGLEPSIGFMCLHLPLADAERHAILRNIASSIEARVPAMAAPGPRRRSRARIGVLSPDFREHLNAYLLRPLFELADRGRFELYAYSLGHDDGSQARAAIRAAADAFRDLRPMGDAQAAQVIRQDDIDILLDVGGHTTDARFAITAQRPARLQVSYLAFPASLASRRVDYAIVDRVVAPEQAEWAERLVYLPHTFFLYDYRTTPNERVARSEYGLPEDAFVFCAFHKAEKITPESFRLWTEILRRVPRSVLWLMGVPAASANLRRQAEQRGVDPSRLIFAPFEPRGRYLSRQKLGDLMLDAVTHSALTTACDALGMGLPVLTFGDGTSFAGRGGESLARAAGMPDLVVSREQYVDAAVRLATERGALARLRQQLAQNRTSAPLFDTAGRVRELEAAFERML